MSNKTLIVPKDNGLKPDPCATVMYGGITLRKVKESVCITLLGLTGGATGVKHSGEASGHKNTVRLDTGGILPDAVSTI